MAMTGFFRAGDHLVDPFHLDRHEKTEGVIDLTVGLDIQPRGIGIERGLGHVRRKAGNHAPFPDHGQKGFDAWQTACLSVHKGIRHALVRHADIHTDVPMGIQDAPGFILIPGVSGHRPTGDGQANDPASDALFGPVYGFDELELRPHAVEGIHAGPEEDLQHLGDSSGVHRFLDIAVLGLAAMGKPEEPIRSYHQARDRERFDGGSRKTILRERIRTRRAGTREP